MSDSILRVGSSFWSSSFPSAESTTKRYQERPGSVGELFVQRAAALFRGLMTELDC